MEDWEEEKDEYYLYGNGNGNDDENNKKRESGLEDNLKELFLTLKFYIMIRAYIFIRLTSFYREYMKKAVESIKAINGIVSVDALFGDIDIIAIAEFHSFEEIKRILEEVYATGMVRDTDTRIVYPV